MITVPFAPTGRETLRGFFDKLTGLRLSLRPVFTQGSSTAAEPGTDAYFRFEKVMR